jgi:Mg/Co/Ni transporter MgtE
MRDGKTIQEEQSMQVKDTMQTGVLSRSPEDVGRAAVQRTRGYHLRHLPVVTGRHPLIGIVFVLPEVIRTPTLKA